MHKWSSWVNAMFLLTLIVISNFTILFVNASDSSSGTIIYSSIIIHSNAELKKMAQKMHWPGNGSAIKPYIIEGYNLTPPLGIDGISIQNTSLHFIIRNTTISYAYNPQSDMVAAGIRLENVTNAILENIALRGDEMGIYILRASNITVRNNRFLNDTTGMFVKHSREIEIEKNYVKEGDAFATVWYSNNTTISNNTAYDYKDVGIVSTISKHIKIVGNELGIREKRRIDEASTSGIWLYSSNLMVVKDNKIAGNYTQWHGIWAQNSKNLTIENNSIYSQVLDGIVIVRDPHCIVEKNIVSFNKNAGIWMVDTHLTTVRENKITYNLKKGYLGSLRGYGVLMDDSQNNIIKGNLFAFNGIGIYIGSGKHNLIYNNSFYYNSESGDKFDESKIQSMDDSALNFWNTSKYGNYWQDWASMNDSNGDGIVDKPYPLRSYNNKKVYDYRPLKYSPKSYCIEPTPPRKLRVEIGVGYLNLTWLRPVGNGTSPLIGYRIYRNGVLIATVSPDTLYYNDTSVKNGVEYEYYITAINSYGESAKSNEVRGIPGIPSKPLNLTACGGDGYVYLTWKTPKRVGASPILWYRIYRVYPGILPPGMGWTGTRKLLATVPGTQHYYNDTNVSNGQWYGYAITAVNLAGEGSLSERVVAIPGRIPTPPRNLRVEIKDGYALLTWDAPKDDGGGIQEYRIYCNGKYVDTISNNNLSFEYKLPGPGEYTFYVTAVNFKGESKPSNNIEISYKITPPQPPKNKMTSAPETVSVIVSVGILIVLILAACIGKLRHSKKKYTEKSNK